MPGVRSAICPVAYITPESIVTLEQLATARRLHNFGAALFGPDLAQWPAFYVEAAAIVDAERISAENERISAERREE